ncbi:MAG TPA: arylsulfatase [Opitutaceae bacterium]
MLPAHTLSRFSHVFSSLAPSAILFSAAWCSAASPGANAVPQPAAQPASPAPRPPDVLLILADDMGFSDIGCYGGEIRTPNLDRLGREGVRFSQAYNAARCCPTRASLLTGQYPHRAGIGHMVSNYGTPAYQGYLREDCVTIAEALRAAGYHTWMTGKWHVGGNQAPNVPATWRPGTPEQPGPLDRGFQRFFGTLGGAGSYFRPPMLMDQRQFVVPGGEPFYYTDEIGRHACDFIRDAARQDDPFFGYVAFTAPHWPLHALPEDIERYRTRYRDGWDALRAERFAALQREGLLPPGQTLPPRDEKAPAWETLDPARRDWESQRMAVYAAMLDRLDQNVGRILDCLEATGRRDNTLVIFLADNGGCAEAALPDGSNMERYRVPTSSGKLPRMGNNPGIEPGPEDTFQTYDLPWANVSNTPFRRFKSWVHEGGIATPLILNHPALNSRSGRIVHTPCHIIDLMPTILDLAGATYPTTRDDHTVPTLPGRSLVATAKAETEPGERTLFWEHEGNRAVRAGNLKLVSEYGSAWELYDLTQDRSETHNLAAENPGEVAALAGKWEAWAKEAGVRDWSQLKRSRAVESSSRAR